MSTASYVLLVALAASAAAQPVRIVPKDVAAGDPSFVAFRAAA